MSARNTNRFLYNPSRLPEEDLLARFIVRKREYALLWEDISHTQRDGIDQHFLIIGQRGMGKTTLMLKVAYEIKRDPDLQEWLIPVNFPEELYGVQDLYGLWEMLAEILEDRFPGLAGQVQGGKQDYSDQSLFEVIRKRIRLEKKKLILFMDNFGDLLDRLTIIEVHRLREILMSAGEIRLVAANARQIDQTYEYDKPFLDFFNTIYLDGLSKDDSLRLMRGFAETRGQLSEFNAILEQHPSRVEALRPLTGGVPRLLQLLSVSIMDSPEGTILDDLEKVLDQVTAHYWHRVKELSRQHQPIFHQVALAWDAVGAGEVATALRADSRKVSAQIQQMIDNDFLEKVETGGKNNLYRIKDRFFNIWYLLRLTRSDTRYEFRTMFSFWGYGLDGFLYPRGKKDNATISLKSRNNLPYWYSTDEEIGPRFYTAEPDHPYGNIHNGADSNELSETQSESNELHSGGGGSRDKSNHSSTGLSAELRASASDPHWIVEILKANAEKGILAGFDDFIAIWNNQLLFEDIIAILEQTRANWKIEEASRYDANPRFPFVKGAISLWNRNFNEAKASILEHFSQESPLVFSWSSEFLLMMMLVRYQHSLCSELFAMNTGEIRTKYKPIWYALQKLMGEAGRKELLRMGPELEENVDEIVDWVQRMRKKYPG